MNRILLLLISLLLVPTLSFSSTITGKVIKVADGDTLTILNGSKKTKIRLYGIDCPEKGQAFGKKAKKFTASLAEWGW
jgi:micrococcal nuclease